MRVLHGMPHVLENSHSRVALSVRAVGGICVHQGCETVSGEAQQSAFSPSTIIPYQRIRFAAAPPPDANPGQALLRRSNTLKRSTTAKSGRTAADRPPIHALSCTPRLR